MEALKDLKWLIVILVVLWALWFFAGGPNKPESKSGPFLNPPAPISSGQVYGQ